MMNGITRQKISHDITDYFASVRQLLSLWEIEDGWLLASATEVRDLDSTRPKRSFMT
jgi:hypothetical protein